MRKSPADLTPGSSLHQSPFSGQRASRNGRRKHCRRALTATFDLDLVILDLNTPKVHGFDVLRRCNSPEMRIIVFSSSSNPEEMRRSFELRAQEFVHKPIRLDEFRQQVTQIVRNWGPPHLVNAGGTNLIT